MKAIVTGGAGFIGSHIVDSLIHDGWEVIVIDNLSTGKLHNLYPRHDNSANLSVTQIDICSEEVEYYMEDVDIIFHNAASKKNICLRNPKRDLEVNAEGTLNLLQLALKYQVKKFVHASTGSVYGEAKIIPQTECHPLNPNSYYGVSKLAGDRYVRMFSEMGLDTTILRYFHVYGSRQEDGKYGGVVAIFLKNAREEKPLVIYGDGTQQRSFTYVKDIVKINRLVAENPETNGEVYNCASATKTTINQLAATVLRVTKSPSRVIYEDWAPGDIKTFDINNSKIRELGIEFDTDIETNLRKMLNYEKIYA